MRFSTLCAGALAVCALGASAVANNNNEPGSLLVFPAVINLGALSIVTVTNTNGDPVNGTIQVEFVYINGANCLEFNKTRTLTPKDEISVGGYQDTGGGVGQGYLYVFAKGASGPNTGVPVKFDHLVGSIFHANGAGLDGESWSYNPVVYKAASKLAEGDATDTDGDGFRDLNGLEYEKSADTLQIPRFLGQGQAENVLFLVNLTGGKSFDAIVDFLIYNDNEEVFSAQYQFRCWSRTFLGSISGAFDNAFLLSTNHALSETSGLLGSPNLPIPIETGWYEMDGNVAFSTAVSFADPAILAVDVQRYLQGSFSDAARLPFHIGSQSNGDLLPVSILGDLTNN